MDLTNAQKCDQRSYGDKNVLVFNRNVRGFKAGESARLKAITETLLIVESNTRTAKVPFRHLDRLTVCECKELALSDGDRLQLKANGRSTDNRKLANGELVVVKKFRSGTFASSNSARKSCRWRGSFTSALVSDSEFITSSARA